MSIILYFELILIAKDANVDTKVEYLCQSETWLDMSTNIPTARIKTRYCALQSGATYTTETLEWSRWLKMGLSAAKLGKAVLSADAWWKWDELDVNISMFWEFWWMVWFQLISKTVNSWNILESFFGKFLESRLFVVCFSESTDSGCDYGHARGGGSGQGSLQHVQALWLISVPVALKIFETQKIPRGRFLGRTAGILGFAIDCDLAIKVGSGKKMAKTFLASSLMPD